jgi:hypothetical protein
MNWESYQLMSFDMRQATYKALALRHLGLANSKLVSILLGIREEALDLLKPV